MLGMSLFGNLCGIFIPNLRIQSCHQHQRILKVFLDHGMIGFEPQKTVIIERGTGITQIAGSHQEIENHDRLEHVEFKMTIHSPNGNGGIISNDLSSYNGQRLLSPSTISTIMQNHTGRLFGGEEKFYGLAFGVLREGGVAKGGLGSVGTFDWGGYFNTQYFADPQEEIVGVLMKQTQGISEETAWKYRLLIHQAIDD